MARACVLSPVEVLGDNGRSEGLGHMAWNVTADAERGVQLCEAFATEEQLYTCVVSVYMEKHFPRPEFSVHPAVAPPVFTEWYATCERLRAASPSLSRGCGGAAAYAWLRAEPLLEGYQPVFDESASQEVRAAAALQTIQGLDRLCLAFPDSDERTGCFMQASSLPWDLLPECAAKAPAARVSASQYACRPVG